MVGGLPIPFVFAYALAFEFEFPAMVGDLLVDLLVFAAGKGASASLLVVTGDHIDLTGDISASDRLRPPKLRLLVRSAVRSMLVLALTALIFAGLPLPPALLALLALASALALPLPVAEARLAASRRAMAARCPALSPRLDRRAAREVLALAATATGKAVEVDAVVAAVGKLSAMAK